MEEMGHITSSNLLGWGDGVDEIRRSRQRGGQGLREERVAGEGVTK